MDLQLASLRKAAGYKSRKSFGEAIGIAERQVKSWETYETRLTLEEACKLADFLDVSLDELAGRWDYVGRCADERQRSLDDAYRSLDDEGRDAALGAVLGMASMSARKKAGSEGAVAGEDVA